MDDVIYRKDAIRVLNAKCKKAFNLTCGEEDCACVEYTALRELPSAQQWIPCSERLPEEGAPVLGSFEDEGGRFILTTSILIFDEKKAWTGTMGLKPIAWMPLPEPYKGKTDG